MGSVDHPFNPLSLALGAEATFVARALDSDRKGLAAVLEAAARHRGTSLVEIYQDCPIFNDGSFDLLRKDGAEQRLIPLRHGEPIVFGAEGEYCVVRNGSRLEVAATADVEPTDIAVHDAVSDEPEYAYALSRLSDQDLGHVVTGVLRSVDRPTYDDQVRARLSGPEPGSVDGLAAAQRLITGSDTWQVWPNGTK